MRTFGRESWNAAQQAWRDGEFSHEWRETRHRAAMRGMIYPPEGSKWDSWEDEAPSQRAMLIRAIRETPSLLEEAIAHSRTWFEVIAYITRRRDDWRSETNARIRDDERRAIEDQPDHREAAMSISQIIKRIGESA